jgi:hypothetical protein
LTRDPYPFTGYAAMDEIIAVYAVARSYAYRIACRDQWRRYRHPDGGVRYRRVDVDRSLSAGAETRRTRRLDRRTPGE